MKNIKMFSSAKVILIAFVFFSFSSTNNSQVCELKPQFSLPSDSTRTDTLTIDIVKTMSIDDVLSMDIDGGRKYAYGQFKNGRKFVVIIPEDMRRKFDSVYASDNHDTNGNTKAGIDTVKIYGRPLTGIVIESEFNGGIKEWYQFMNKTLVYPDDAINNGITGEVVMRFVINENGKVSDINTVSGPVQLRKAALAMISKSPDWLPATLNGFRVKSYKTQPVNFKIESDQQPGIKNEESRQGNIQESQFENTAGLDTLSVAEMKNLTMNDVDSMTVNKDRTQAFIKLKNGKRYVVIISDDMRKTADVKYKHQNNVGNTNKSIESSKIDTSSDYDKTFTKTEISAAYPGGPAAWERYLYRHLYYPKDAVKQEIQGQVIVRFIVNIDGTLGNIEAISGPSELRDNAVTLIKQSGKWVPAIQNGRKVKAYCSQPINYRLEN
jgi:TonB family protein